MPLWRSLKSGFINHGPVIKARSFYQNWYYDKGSLRHNALFWAEMNRQVPGYDRVYVMRRSMYSVSLMTILRDKDTAKREFVEAAKKLSTMVFNEAMSLLPHTPR